MFLGKVHEAKVSLMFQNEPFIMFIRVLRVLHIKGIVSHTLLLYTLLAFMIVKEDCTGS